MVYPAGFLYLFDALRRVTGGAVPAAQLCFAAFYLATQAGVMALYIHAQVAGASLTRRFTMSYRLLRQ